MVAPPGALFRFKHEDALPIVLHAHHRPAFGFRLVDALVETADACLAVVGTFAFGVGVTRPMKRL
jgi:hypothetical protein